MCKEKGARSPRPVQAHRHDRYRSPERAVPYGGVCSTARPVTARQGCDTLCFVWMGRAACGVLMSGRAGVKQREALYW